MICAMCILPRIFPVPTPGRRPKKSIDVRCWEHMNRRPRRPGRNRKPALAFRIDFFFLSGIRCCSRQTAYTTNNKQIKQRNKQNNSEHTDTHTHTSSLAVKAAVHKPHQTAPLRADRRHDRGLRPRVYERFDPHAIDLRSSSKCSSNNNKGRLHRWHAHTKSRDVCHHNYQRHTLIEPPEGWVLRTL